MFGIDQNTAFLMGILLIIALFGYKFLAIYEKSKYNAYKLQRKTLNLKKAKNQKKNVQDDDEVEDFIESLPPWLKGICDGANIDLVAVYNGDPTELKKVGDMIQKNVGQQGTANGEGYL